MTVLQGVENVKSPGSHAQCNASSWPSCEVPAEPDYPAWLAEAHEEETHWEVDDDDEFFLCFADAEAETLCVNGCVDCGREIDVFDPKEHCAVCGQMLCSECSYLWAVLPHLGRFGKQLTCKGCYVGITGNRSICPAIMQPSTKARMQQSFMNWLASIL